MSDISLLSPDAVNVTQPTSLKRTITLPLLLLYGLGTILGAGIYVLIGEVAGATGHYAPLSFLCAAIVAGLTGLSYAELSSRFPLSAGEAVYIKNGLHSNKLALLAGLMVVGSGVVSSAAVTQGSIGYLQVFIGLPAPLLIVVVLLIIGAVAVWGITESITVAAFFTLIEIVGLLVVVWVGRHVFADPIEIISEFTPPADITIWLQVTTGAFLAFFAFIGFEDMVNVAEEVKTPQRTLPLAIVFSLVICTLLYIAIAVVAINLATVNELTGNRAPLAFLYERATGQQPWFIGGVSVFAVLNGALIQIIMASRMLYGMSKQSLLPQAFAKVHPRTRTPVLATGFVVILVMVFALYLPLVTLAGITSFVLLLVFLLVNLSLLGVKAANPSHASAPVFSRWIPVTGAVTCLMLIIIQSYVWLFST